jgi:hypothetical protein
VHVVAIATLIQNNSAVLCDFNGLACPPGNNCTTGAQRFLAALSNREQSTSNVDAR